MLQVPKIFLSLNYKYCYDDNDNDCPPSNVTMMLYMATLVWMMPLNAHKIVWMLPLNVHKIETFLCSSYLKKILTAAFKIKC